MDTVTNDQFNEALKTVNRYYRQVSGKKECIKFYVDYIQPIKECINEISMIN